MAYGLQLNATTFLIYQPSGADEFVSVKVD